MPDDTQPEKRDRAAEPMVIIAGYVLVDEGQRAMPTSRRTAGPRWIRLGAPRIEDFGGRPDLEVVDAARVDGVGRDRQVDHAQVSLLDRTAAVSRVERSRSRGSRTLRLASSARSPADANRSLDARQALSLSRESEPLDAELQTPPLGSMRKCPCARRDCCVGRHAAVRAGTDLPPAFGESECVLPVRARVFARVFGGSGGEGCGLVECRSSRGNWWGLWRVNTSCQSELIVRRSSSDEAGWTSASHTGVRRLVVTLDNLSRPHSTPATRLERSARTALAPLLPMPASPVQNPCKSGFLVMERAGFEPAASDLQSRRSPS
jgi:hypothetical protein